MVSAKEDHLVVGIGPSRLRYFFHKNLFHFQNRCFLGSDPKPLGYPFHMGVNGDRRNMEADAHDDIRCFAPYAGQFCQFFQSSGHFAVEVFQQHFAAFLDVRGFVPVQTDRLDFLHDRLKRGSKESLWRRESAEQTWRNFIDGNVCCLGAEKCRDQQLKHIPMQMFALRIREQRSHLIQGCYSLFFR